MRNPKKSMRVEGWHLIYRDLESNEPKKDQTKQPSKSLELFPACSLVAEKGKPRARSLNEVFTTSHDVNAGTATAQSIYVQYTLSWQRETSRIRNTSKLASSQLNSFRKWLSSWRIASGRWGHLATTFCWRDISSHHIPLESWARWAQKCMQYIGSFNAIALKDSVPLWFFMEVLLSSVILRINQSQITQLQPPYLVCRDVGWRKRYCHCTIP